MFQRLSSLLFGEVEEVSAELSGPKPCVTEADEEGWMLVNLPEGASAEASPMEDLLIEHPSMSVYVSPVPALVSHGNLPLVSHGNLSVVGEESVASLAGSVSRAVEPASAPAARGATPARVPRPQPGALAKVTQVGRVQRGKARAERRHLGRNRLQRQNRAREQPGRHGTHARSPLLHQPGQRSLCH